MAYPDLYDVTYSYTGFQQSQGDNSFPGTQIDADLAGLQTTIQNVDTFMQSVMRSDGALNNGIVTFDSLAPSLQTAGLTPALPWASGVNYPRNGSVVIGANLYRAAIAHTSGVFATDLAAGKWTFVTALAGSQFVQNGVGAVVRTVASKLQESVSVTDYGAKGDGTTDDTAAIQAAINAVMAAGGGTVYFPATASNAGYKTVAQIVIDTSAIATRFLGRVRLVGAGPATSFIINSALGAAAIYYKGGGVASPEAYFSIEHLRVSGNLLGGSTGIAADNAVAYLVLRDVIVEGFDLGLFFTDVEQIGIYDCEIRYNNQGIQGNPSAIVTDPNEWLIVNTAIGTNYKFGAVIFHANNIAFIGGSAQYNGTIAGSPSTQWGIKIIDAGTGYGTVLFDGYVFEGNGGAGDFVSSQSAGAFKTNVTFNNVSWARTSIGGVGYGTNQISITGAGTNANYKVINSNFWGYGPYVASAGRPAISNTNANARLVIDETTSFWSATEAPVSSPPSTIYRGSAWATFTPTITASSGTFTATTAAGRWMAFGKTAWFEITITVTTIGTAAGSMLASLPFTANSACVVPGMNLSVGATVMATAPTAATQIAIFHYDGTFPVKANGQQFIITGTCETT